METNEKNKKIDNLNLNLSVFSKREKNAYNYAKIFQNLDWLKKNQILSESDCEKIKKTGLQNFVECKTKFGECSEQKKKIRKFVQNLRNRIEAEKNGEIKKELQRNYDIICNFVF